jgi:hypothetical protein
MISFSYSIAAPASQLVATVHEIDDQLASSSAFGTKGLRREFGICWRHQECRNEKILLANLSALAIQAFQSISALQVSIFVDHQGHS